MMNETMKQEVREARAAGIRALNSLRQAQRCLDSARGWGVLDILGGGLITNLVKHSKLSDAQRCIDQAQYDLDAFRRELADVNLPYAEIDGVLTFADFFKKREKPQFHYVSRFDSEGNLLETPPEATKDASVKRRISRRFEDDDMDRY